MPGVHVVVVVVAAVAVAAVAAAEVVDAEHVVAAVANSYQYLDQYCNVEVALFVVVAVVAAVNQHWK